MTERPEGDHLMSAIEITPEIRALLVEVDDTLMHVMGQCSGRHIFVYKTAVKVQKVLKGCAKTPIASAEQKA